MINEAYVVLCVANHQSNLFDWSDTIDRVVTRRSLVLDGLGFTSDLYQALKEEIIQIFHYLENIYIM